MIKLTVLNTGYCLAFGAAAMHGGPLRPVRVPALCALLEHPQHGLALFDTGYADAFYRQTRRFPQVLYRLLTPVPQVRPVVEQLRARGIAPGDVQTVVISHFHGDHVAGLTDFPAARLVYAAPAWDAIKAGRGRALAGLRAGVLWELLPPGFDERAEPFMPADFAPLPADLAPFERGFDLFGDASVWLVALSGHAVGQVGAFVQTEDGPVLLAADACWHSREYREHRPATLLARAIIADLPAYNVSLRKLYTFHQRRPDVPILPSHCPEVLARWT